jgi:hypothetical protein
MPRPSTPRPGTAACSGRAPEIGATRAAASTAPSGAEPRSTSAVQATIERVVGHASAPSSARARARSRHRSEPRSVPHAFRSCPCRRTAYAGVRRRAGVGMKRQLMAAARAGTRRRPARAAAAPHGPHRRQGEVREARAAVPVRLAGVRAGSSPPHALRDDPPRGRPVRRLDPRRADRTPRPRTRRTAVVVARVDRAREEQQGVAARSRIDAVRAPASPPLARGWARRRGRRERTRRATRLEVRVVRGGAVYTTPTSSVPPRSALPLRAADGRCRACITTCATRARRQLPALYGGFAPRATAAGTDPAREPEFDARHGERAPTPAARRARAAAAAAARSTCRASATNASPAALGRTPCFVRRKRATPSSRSTSATCAASACGATCSRRAARPNDPASAASTM